MRTEDGTARELERVRQSEIPMNISLPDAVSASAASGFEFAPQSRLRILIISMPAPRSAGASICSVELGLPSRRARTRGDRADCSTSLAESEGERPATLQVIGVPDRTFAFLRRLGLLGRQTYYLFWNRAAARSGETSDWREYDRRRPPVHVSYLSAPLSSRPLGHQGGDLGSHRSVSSASRVHCFRRWDGRCGANSCDHWRIRCSYASQVSGAASPPPTMS